MAISIHTIIWVPWIFLRLLVEKQSKKHFYWRFRSVPNLIFEIGIFGCSTFWFVPQNIDFNWKIDILGCGRKCRTTKNANLLNYTPGGPKKDCKRFFKPFFNFIRSFHAYFRWFLCKKQLIFANIQIREKKIVIFSVFFYDLTVGKNWLFLHDKQCKNESNYPIKLKKVLKNVFIEDLDPFQT